VWHYGVRKGPIGGFRRVTKREETTHSRKGHSIGSTKPRRCDDTTAFLASCAHRSQSANPAQLLAFGVDQWIYSELCPKRISPAQASRTRKLPPETSGIFGCRLGPCPLSRTGVSVEKVPPSKWRANAGRPRRPKPLDQFLPPPRPAASAVHLHPVDPKPNWIT
jgi:hypothetical protein